MRKFYVPEIGLIGTILQLPEDEARHFAIVLRGKVGDEIRLLNGKGVLANGKVESIGGSRRVPEVVVKIETYEENFWVGPEICLYVACPRTKQIELILRQCVELGVSQIHPIISEFTISRPEKNAQKWDDLLIEAMKQSGNPFLPKIFPIKSFDEALSQSPPQLGFYGAVPTDENICESWPEDKSLGRRVAYWVGPEGGFSNAELKALQEFKVKIDGKVYYTYLPLTVGCHILRMETAVTAGLGLLVSNCLPMMKQL